MAVRTPQEKKAINRFLGTHGLPPLESGSGLLAALGYMVRDHEHFRTMVARCDPEMRSQMYAAMKPYVSFELHPLDWYIAESGRLAEAKGLPLLNEDGSFDFQSDARGTGLCVCGEDHGIYFNSDMTPMCKGCRRPLPNPDQARAQDAVDWGLAKKILTVTCVKCTKQAQFPGVSKQDAVMNARREGWVYYERDGKPVEICPDCPGVREAPRPEPEACEAEFVLVSEFKLQDRGIITFYMEMPGPLASREEWDAAALAAAKRWAVDGKPTESIPVH